MILDAWYTSAGLGSVWVPSQASTPWRAGGWAAVVAQASLKPLDLTVNPHTQTHNHTDKCCLIDTSTHGDKHTHTHTYTHTHTHTYIHTYAQAHGHIRLMVYMRMHTHLNTFSLVSSRWARG